MVGGAGQYNPMILKFMRLSNVHQAFVVTAGISLTLDLFHRTDQDSEAEEYKSWIERAIALLQRWSYSYLASHGIRLLTSLLNERVKRIEATRAGAHPLPSATVDAFPKNISPAALAHASADAIQTDDQTTTAGQVPPNSDGWYTGTTEFDLQDFGRFMDTFPVEAGLDNTGWFEEMMSLAHEQFF